MTAPRPLTAEQEAALARYRSGVMTQAERASFERAVLTDDALAEALYSELALDRMRAPARTAGAAPGLHWGSGLAIAASLLVVAGAVVFWPRTAGLPPDHGETLRGGDVTAAAPLEPLGEIPGPPTWFRWRRDPGAESYRLEVFAVDGRKAATTVTADTAIAAATIGADSLTSGSWRVVPIAADGRELARPPAVPFGVPR